MKPGIKILISIGAGIACFLLSIFSQLLLMPFLALAAFMAAVWSPLYMLPALIGAAAGSLLPSAYDAGTFVTVGTYLLLPVFLTVSIRTKLPHRFTALGCAVLLTVGMYLSMTVDSLIAGDPPYAEAVRVWEVMMLEPLRETFSSDPGYASFLEGLESFTSYIPDVIMPSCVLSGCGVSLGLTVLTRLFYKLFRVEPHRKMARFIDWRLPHTALWGSLILLAVIPVAFIFRFERSIAITASVAAIVLGMFSVQGLAYLSFVLTIAKAPGGLKAILYLLAAVFFPHSMVVLSVFGVREQIRNDRRLMRKMSEDDRGMKEAERRSDEIYKYGYTRDEKPGDNENEDNEDNGPKEDK